jgi:rubredoxin
MVSAVFDFPDIAARIARKTPPGPACKTCDGDGWVYDPSQVRSALIPRTIECPVCGNPKGHPQP